MNIRRISILISIAACNGGSGSDGTNGDPGSQGQQGSQGLQGAPGPVGPSGAAAILVATDELRPDPVQIAGTGPGDPPRGYCVSPDYTFTTTTGHVLIQRTDSNGVSLDGAWLMSFAGTAQTNQPMLMATRVTPNAPHTLAAYAGPLTVTNWFQGACLDGDIAIHGCTTEAGDNPQCWCPPTFCPSQGTIVVTELAP